MLQFSMIYYSFKAFWIFKIDLYLIFFFINNICYFTSLFAV